MIPHIQDDASSTQRLEGVTGGKLTKVSKVSPDGSSKVMLIKIYNHKIDVGLFDCHVSICQILFVAIFLLLQCPGSNLLAGTAAQR